MTRSTRFALTVAASVLCAATLLAPRSAVAEPETWVHVPCATGTIGHSFGASDGGLVLGGWIEPCDDPDPAARFGVMYYFAQEATISPGPDWHQRLRPFATTGRTRFSVDVFSSLHPDERGVPRASCLVRSPNGKIACLEILVLEDRVTVSPIPTDSPLTARCWTDDPDPMPTPHCGFCV